VILGDAAHAMLPHHGQGANTTIEDAITLAELLLRTIHVPCVLPSLPRWNRQLRISLASPTTATFPVILAGRLPHWLFRGHCHINRFYWSVLSHWQRSVSIVSMG
jgi:2-polyprenyl-6-methoxyphenol hydroxylase-like FAD-dependent oxidoreductase